MNKTYVTLAVLVLIVAGSFLLFKNKKLEEPAMVNEPMSEGQTKMQLSSMPADYNTPVTNTTAPIKEFTVTGQNFSFTPNTLSVKKGDLVKITFKNADGFHDFRIGEYKVATRQIRAGEEETVEFLADKMGNFQYYCSVGTHRAMGMWGTLSVQ